ncbi:hypothetical protein ACFWCB_05155 [Streptomyces sp. NPDC060048]|uniref:hypothetical protein n=1 Tax=unclassified Streptomyces TaxID=2593676 RepID=UPI00368BFC5D
MTSRLPPRETDHYTQLADPAVVTTRALLAARENITDTIDARAMMCLHGPADVGKTLAANVCQRELERTRGEEVCRVASEPAPRTGRDRPDQEVLRWSFSRLGSWRGSWQVVEALRPHGTTTGVVGQ